MTVKVTGPAVLRLWGRDTLVFRTERECEYVAWIPEERLQWKDEKEGRLEWRGKDGWYLIEVHEDTRDGEPGTMVVVLGSVEGIKRELPTPPRPLRSTAPDRHSPDEGVQ